MISLGLGLLNTIRSRGTGVAVGGMRGINCGGGGGGGGSGGSFAGGLRPLHISPISSIPVSVGGIGGGGLSLTLRAQEGLYFGGSGKVVGGGVSSILSNPTLVFTRGLAKKAKGRVKDRRVRMIRYSLNHPLTPRPLKFGTMRMLRHWTIHRAWLLYQRKLHVSRERELERQWNKMREACETLSRADERLYRIAVNRKEVGYFPVEMRIPTDTPPREGWNHGWVRAQGKGNL